MAITNGYITLAELQGWVKANDATGFTSFDNTNLEEAINAASRWLDDHFDTSFYERTETRFLTAEFSDLLYTPDLLSIATSLKTDTSNDGTYDTTWATTDYYLEPRNAALGSQPKPYRQIRINPNGVNSFPTYNYGVEIVGTWGYSTLANIPKEIRQATLMISQRLWKRKDSWAGIAGAPALGVTIIQARIQKDSDLAMLLEGVSRRGF